MNNQNPIGSTFEMALRLLLLTDECHHFPLKLEQLCCIDFIAVYAADFGLFDENLHGYGIFRFSEFPARKKLVDKASKWLTLIKFLNFNQDKSGYTYTIATAGKKFASHLKSPYAEEYRLAVQTVIKNYNFSESAMTTAIHQRSIASLQER